MYHREVIREENSPSWEYATNYFHCPPFHRIIQSESVTEWAQIYPNIHQAVRWGSNEFFHQRLEGGGGLFFEGAGGKPFWVGT